MDTLGWQELKVVALAVDDLARAESFYRSRLGLERRLQADGDVGFALGGLTILLKPLSAPGGGAEKSPYPRLTIAVADAPRLARDLLSLIVSRRATSPAVALAVQRLWGAPSQAAVALCGDENDYRGHSARIDVVIDCAGYIKHIPGPPPLEIALHCLANRGGRIVCFGGYEDKMLIDFGYVIKKEPVIIGSNGYAAEELVEALQMMKDGTVDRQSLISHSYPLERIGEAFEMQATPAAVKVMLEIPQAEPVG